MSAHDLTLGGGSRPDITSVEKTLAPGIKFLHAGGDIRWAWTGTVMQVYSDPEGTPTLIGTVPIANSGVTPNTYGTASAVPQFAVNAMGQITSATDVIITVGTTGINDNAVTDAKLRNSQALSVIGRSANTNGDPADILAGSNGDILRMSGGTLGFGAITAFAMTWTGSPTWNCAVFETGIISITLGATTSNWAPAGFATCNQIRLTPSAVISLTGIAGGASGRRLTLHNVGSNTVTMTHDATSTAANRFLCPGSVNFSLTANMSIDLWYDGTSSRWRIIG